jgi:hypothetical protein
MKRGHRKQRISNWCMHEEKGYINAFWHYPQLTDFAFLNIPNNEQTQSYLKFVLILLIPMIAKFILRMLLHIFLIVEIQSCLAIL